jgi:hypothetical protein
VCLREAHYLTELARTDQLRHVTEHIILCRDGIARLALCQRGSPQACCSARPTLWVPSPAGWRVGAAKRHVLRQASCCHAWQES